jgi:hypothetical protein
MAKKIAHNLPTTNKPAYDDTKSNSGAECATPTTSSSPPQPPSRWQMDKFLSYQISSRK